MATRDECEAATAAGKRMHATTPHSVAARYDRQADRIVVTLNTAVDVSFSPRDAQGLEDASADELAVIEITPPGFGLHWPKLDADLYVPACSKACLARGAGWPRGSAPPADDRAAKPRPQRAERTASSAEGRRRNALVLRAPTSGAEK